MAYEGIWTYKHPKNDSVACVGGKYKLKLLGIAPNIWFSVAHIIIHHQPTLIVLQLSCDNYIYMMSHDTRFSTTSHEDNPK